MSTFQSSSSLFPMPSARFPASRHSVALRSAFYGRFFHSSQKKRNRLPYLKPDLSAKEAYDELGHACRKVDYQKIHMLVKLLVTKYSERPNARLYNALIVANAHPEYGSAPAMSSLLIEMVDQDMTPDSATYHAAIKVLAIHPDYILRKDILEELSQRWFSLTTDGLHDVIQGLIRDRQIEVAMNKLEELRSRNVSIHPALLDTVVYTLCTIGELDEALKLLKYRMSTSDSSISPSLWAHFLDICSRSLHIQGTQLAWRGRVKPQYFNPSSGTCLNILNTAARHGDSALAAEVFGVLDKRKHTFQLHHYEALLEAWLASGDLRSAFTVLCAMATAGTQPSEASTRAIFIHLAEDRKRVRWALKVLHQLVDSGHKVPHAAINVIIGAQIHHSDLPSALETYQSLHTIVPSGPNTATFNTLFQGCMRGQRKDLAMFLASEMLALEIPPNALTYDWLILTCLNWETEGEEGFADAWKYFEEMKSMGWWPRAGTLKELAISGCLLADRRVDALSNGEQGLDEKSLQYFQWMYWGKRRREESEQGEEINVDGNEGPRVESSSGGAEHAKKGQLARAES